MSGVFRKEYKYVIPVSKYLSLKPWLEQLLKPDTHGENGCYTVRSLYFDSLYDNDYYDNVDGMLIKRKIRLRAYLPDLDKLHLEWKCKEGSDGLKYSLQVTRQEAEQMMLGDYFFLSSHKDGLSRRMYQRLLTGAYHPKTLVEYDRIAYSYPSSDVRVTFDRNVRGTTTGQGFFEKYPGFLPLTNYAQGILEIKYNDFLPYPIRQFTSYLDGLPQANSKYTQARTII